MTDQLQLFRAVLRVGENILIGLVKLPDRPKSNETFLVGRNTVFICKRTLDASNVIIADVDAHRHAPLQEVSERIKGSKLIKLTARKAKEYEKRYFLV